MYTHYEKEFKINKEKRTVVCIIRTEDDIYNIIRKYCHDSDTETILIPFESKIYKGIAKCSPEDEWDEAYGKRLAEYRAMRKRQVYVNNKLKRFYRKKMINLTKLISHGFLKTPKKPDEAGKARSGDVYDIDISDTILQKAVENTVEMLKLHVDVEGERE